MKFSNGYFFFVFQQIVISKTWGPAKAMGEDFEEWPSGTSVGLRFFCSTSDVLWMILKWKI